MSPTTEQVLFVDDEPNVLDGIQRSLRNKVAIQTAVGGAEGLRLLQDAGPFAVVVSDMRMPGMDGAQFLAKVRQHSSRYGANDLERPGSSPIHHRSRQ